MVREFLWTLEEQENYRILLRSTNPWLSILKTWYKKPIELLCIWKCTETVVHRCSSKWVFLKISQTSQQNTCPRASFLIKLQTWKETLAQVFSREFKKTFKNYFFYRTTPVAVSECICPICIYSFSEAALKKMFLKFRKINMKATVFESLSQYSGRPLR